jgi:hypothetical protein
MIAEPPFSEQWYIAVWYRSCPDLKGEDYGHWILSVIVFSLKVVYRFKLVYSLKVVYRWDKA